MEFVVGAGVRCDLVGYAARNLSGKRRQVQFFPTGSRRGGLDGSELSSVVIRAFHGTRVTFCASRATSDWHRAAWRTVVLTEGFSMPSGQRNGLPGVRIPDLDLLDAFNAKKAETAFESSYPLVELPTDGEGWTFGRSGGLKNRVAVVRIEREQPASPRWTRAERVARAIVERLEGDAARVAVEAALDALGDEGDAFREWSQTAI